MSFEETIRVDNVSKCFLIYDRPQDRLKQFVIPRVEKMMGKSPSKYFLEFWALQDVSLSVRRGETVGIIGRNGSGKSTLLQLICGTLTPTSGLSKANGRVAALLELGSGFNPEFTGRENINLNAALFGLSQDEIEERYPDIVAFADIGEFIDQPIKMYSSGMMVRLAFAVIAHVDADVLIVDEALAVGDAVFTQKCMRWLRGFQERGTVLFVSHDTASVVGLCDRAIWLHQGQVKASGPAREAVEEYLHFANQTIAGDQINLVANKPEQCGASLGPEFKKTEPNLQALLPEVEEPSKIGMRIKDNLGRARGWRQDGTRITDVRLTNLSNPDRNFFEGGEYVRLEITADSEITLDQPILGFLFRDRLGQDLFGENTMAYRGSKPTKCHAGGSVRAAFEFRLPFLPNGDYEIFASLANGTLESHIQYHLLHDALVCKVSSSHVRYGLVGIPFTNVEITGDGRTIDTTTNL